jgi:hypothetical protein
MQEGELQREDAELGGNLDLLLVPKDAVEGPKYLRSFGDLR